jgi:serine/threonine protein kinase
MEQVIDQVLRDRYQITSLLSRQTGRRTLLAQDLQKGCPVVIKLMLFGPDFTWEELKLFEREAAVLQSLDHPAIPQYLDYFEVDTVQGKGFALVQTYIEATSLQGWVQSGRTFSEVDLKAIAQSLLHILDYLHNRQPPVIHRDIKPSNVLLSDRSGNSPGQIYLVDFGSVQTAAHGGTRTIVGTYGYMPPEQFGGQITPSTDLYALGATLIYLATGQHPDQLPQRNMQIQFESTANLSPKLLDWLQWLTEPSVDLRLRSVKQALEALETDSLRKGGLVRIAKPVGSKVRLTNTRQMLEILIPPAGFNVGLISLIAFAIPWNLTVLPLSFASFRGWNSGGWFFVLFMIPFWITGLSMILGILISLFGKIRLRITQSKILLACELFGLRLPSSLSETRQSITKIELTRLSYKAGVEGGHVDVPPRIIIWAGTRKFELNHHSYFRTLVSPELDWLAEELSQWLDLPITRS